MYYFKLLMCTGMASLCWLGFVGISSTFGWWMKPIATPGDTQGFFQSVAQIIESENQGNAALVLIENGEVVSEYYSTKNEIVDGNTVFLVASMSKWFTASAIMKLVQEGSLGLDEPVSNYLTRWQLPPSEFANSEVTIRRLLSHTAGFTDGLGFGDYSAAEELPTLEESLSNPRASDGREVKLAVERQPGSEFIYSGGSYHILELVIEEVTKVSFEEYMRKTFFSPLNMSRSTYNYIANIQNNAGTYDTDGQAAPAYKYASSAATGLAISASDLAKFVMAQIPNSRVGNILDQSLVKSMREPHGKLLGSDVWGLGSILYSPTKNNDFIFGHDGGNDPAINTTARVNPENGDAIIVLETGHPSLATNIGSHWVLWQTGYPDVLDTDSVLESMYVPILVGLIFIFAVAVYIAVRRSRRLGVSS